MLRPASLSRELQSENSAPVLLHSLRESRGSVLSLATDDKYIYAGTQRQDILVLVYPRLCLCISLPIRSGTKLISRFNIPSVVTREVSWRWNMPRIDDGFLVLEVCFEMKICNPSESIRRQYN